MIMVFAKSWAYPARHKCQLSQKCLIIWALIPFITIISTVFSYFLMLAVPVDQKINFVTNRPLMKNPALNLVLQKWDNGLIDMSASNMPSVPCFRLKYRPKRKKQCLMRRVYRFERYFRHIRYITEFWEEISSGADTAVLLLHGSVSSVICVPATIP